MNIDDLTVGQARQLAAMFAQARQLAAMFAGQPAPAAAPHPFVGRYVICRCSAAGVHAGALVSVNGDTVILRNSRRLWQWQARDGVALSGVAQTGLAGGKIDTSNPEIQLMGVCEIIPCSDAARESIQNAN